MFHGVYVDARAPDTRELRAAALHLVRPQGAVFYGATVAYLLGVDTFAPRDRFNFKPQCVVPHHEGRSKRADVICHEGYLPEGEIMLIDGLLVTSPLRATVDMLRSMWRPHALAAADAMARAGHVNRLEVMSYVARMKRYPGIVQARALAALIEPLAESPGESHQRLRLVDAGFPVPTPQVRVYNRVEQLIARLDNGYPESKVGMEYDGREWHDDDEAIEHDGGKRAYLRESLGWRLAVTRRSDIFGDDMSFELQVGEWLGISPAQRRW